MIGLIEDVYEKGIDIEGLPYDCPARANERLGKFWWENHGKFTKDYTVGDYSKDMDIVVGDPCVGVSISEEGVREVFGLN